MRKIILLSIFVASACLAKAQNAEFTADTSQFTSLFVHFISQYADTDTATYDFDWDFGDGQTSNEANPYHMYGEPGTYTITLTVSQGAVSDVFTLDIELVDIFEVPNVFSPNGDGINDFFVVRSNGVTRLKIEIYGRRGNIVFETTASTIVWDGRTPYGDYLHPGVYFYRISSEDGNPGYEKTGFIHLFR